MRIVDLVDPAVIRQTMSLEIGILYANELEQLARLLSGAPVVHSESHLLSLLNQPGTKYILCCWIVPEEPPSNEVIDFLSKIRPR